MQKQYLVKFKKPYSFEGKEYTEIDLSGVEELKVNDLAQAEIEYAAGGNTPAMQEMSIAYSAYVAAKAAKLPIAFFLNLPAKDGIRIKMALQYFFYE